MFSFATVLSAILLIFYLWLLVHPQHITNRVLYWIGAAGIILAFIAGFFTPWLGNAWANILVGILATLGIIVAFVFAFLACSRDVLGGRRHTTTTTSTTPPGATV